MTKTNPYGREKGFSKRVAYAKARLKKLARDSAFNIYTRGFDNCFENFDGDAVVWQLMHEAQTDTELKKGIQYLFFDKTLAIGAEWPQGWLEIYQTERD